MTPPVEDRHFRAFCASGDPADLARVFDPTAPKLLRVAVHLTGEIQASEDLVQATFLSAIEGADRYRVTAPVLSWLLGILANHARHARRQNLARALRRPAGTVRTQIVRAMELVRKSLPTGFTVGTAVTATAGHSLAAVRATVLAHVFRP